MQGRLAVTFSAWLALLLATACTAHAGTVSISGSTLTYTDVAGETNDVSVSRLSADTTKLRIDEAGTLIGGGAATAALGAGTGSCSQGSDTTEVDCPVAGITLVRFVLGSGSNHARGGGANGGEDTYAGDIRFEGGSSTDVLTGSDGDDVLIGGLGGDQISGGNGLDIVSYEDRLGPVTASVATDGNDPDGDTYASIEGLRGTNAAGDNLSGDANANVLIGGAGGDTLIGGTGFDVASYAERGTISFDLGVDNPDGDSYSSIDQIYATDGPDTIVGSAGSNNIDAGGGDDSVKGGLGADTLIGGPGTDTVSFSGDGHSTGVTANLATGTSSDSDQLTTFENLTGGPEADLLVGDVGVNTIDGGGADDTLIGGGGPDVLDGAAGNDTASWDDGRTSGVTVNLTLGTSTDGDSLLSIANLTGTGFTDVLGGDGGVNTLDGLGGNDTLVGGAGADVLVGGTGTADTASYEDGRLASVVADLATGANTDGDVYPGGEIENLTGGIGSDTLTGNAGANVLAGGDGDDTLRGGLGADTLGGDNGSDSASYSERVAGVSISLDGSANDGTPAEADNVQADVETVVGGDGNDTLVGSAAAETLIGAGGNDLLEGLGGADVFDGGAGDDTLKARDDVKDTGTCGTGTDSAEIDALDALTDCEASALPPVPPPTTETPPPTTETPVPTTETPVPVETSAPPPAPTAAQITTALSGGLVPSPLPKIGQLLKAGTRVSLTSPVAGAVVVRWYFLPKGARLAKAVPLLVASGRTTVVAGVRSTVKLVLTKRGKVLLKRAKTLKLTAKATLTRVGSAPLSVTKRFTARR